MSTAQNPRISAAASGTTMAVSAKSTSAATLTIPTDSAPPAGDVASRRAAFQAKYPNSGVPSPAPLTPSTTSSVSSRDNFDEIVMNGVKNEEKNKAKKLDFSYKNLPVSEDKNGRKAVAGEAGAIKCDIM